MAVSPVRGTLRERFGIRSIMRSLEKETLVGLHGHMSTREMGFCNPRTCQGLRRLRVTNSMPSPPLIGEKTEEQKVSFPVICPTAD